MSRLLSLLDEEIRTEANPVLLAELKIKKSCYLSRTGYFSLSRDLILDVRKNFGAGQNARVSILIMLAEGLVEYFENLGLAARDRIARAQLIALAVKDRELSALTSAWKAHMDFESSDFQSLVHSLRVTFSSGDLTNHQAIARASSVMSNVCFLYGDRVSGRRWFMKCRDHALADGDQAMVDAILYNRAALGLSNLRVDRCLGVFDPDLADLVKLEIETTKNYEEIIKNSALKQLNILSTARIRLLNHDFEGAISSFVDFRKIGRFNRNSITDDYAVLEMVYCLAQLDRIVEAFEMYEEIADVDFSDLDIDDRLVIAWIRCELCSRSPVFGNLESSKAALATISQSYVRHRSSLLDEIKEFDVLS